MTFPFKISRQELDSIIECKNNQDPEIILDSLNVEKSKGIDPTKRDEMMLRREIFKDKIEKRICEIFTNTVVKSKFQIIVGAVAMLMGLLAQNEACFYQGFASVLFTLTCTLVNSILEKEYKKVLKTMHEASRGGECFVIRNGLRCAVPINEVCVGDVLVLSEDKYVEFHSLVIESDELVINEEDIEVGRQIARNTKVTSGGGLAVVLSVNEKIQENERATSCSESISKNLSTLSRLSALSLFIILFVRDAPRSFTRLAELLLQVVVLSNAVTPPQELASIASFLFSAKKLLRNRCILKEPEVLDALSQCTSLVLFKDSLTYGSKVTRILMGEKIYDTEQQELCRLQRSSLLAESIRMTCEDWKELMEVVEDIPLDENEPNEVRRVHYSYETRYALTVVTRGNVCRVFVVGNEDAVSAAFAIKYSSNEEAKMVEKMKRDHSNSTLICAVYVDVPIRNNRLEYSELTACNHIALLVIENSVKRSVYECVRLLKNSGIHTRFVDENEMKVAVEMSKNAGIFIRDSLALDASAFRTFTDIEFYAVAPRLHVLSNSMPQDGARLVERLRSLNEVVCVCSSRNCDETAMKKSNVSVAAGADTGLRREASMIVLGDPLRGVLSGIKSAKRIRNSIRSFFVFRLTSCMTLCILQIICAVFCKATPFNGAQLSWLILIMDLSSIALATQQREDRDFGSLFKREQRIFIVVLSMFHIGLFSVIFGLSKCISRTISFNAFASSLFSLVLACSEPIGSRSLMLRKTKLSMSIYGLQVLQIIVAVFFKSLCGERLTFRGSVLCIIVAILSYGVSRITKICMTRIVIHSNLQV